MLASDMLDLRSRDVLAPHPHAVGHAAVEIEIAGGVGGTEIAGVECAVAQRLRGCSGSLKYPRVSAPGSRSRTTISPRSPGATGLPAASSERDIEPGQGLADRADRAVVVVRS